MTIINQFPDISDTFTEIKDLKTLKEYTNALQSQIDKVKKQIPPQAKPTPAPEEPTHSNQPSRWQRIKNYISSDSFQDKLTYFKVFCIAILCVAAFIFLAFLVPLIGAGEI